MEEGPARVEFYRVANRLEDAIKEQGHRGRQAHGREADGLRETAGWIAISFAFWLLLVGYTLIRGHDRGRPHRG